MMVAMAHAKALRVIGQSLEAARVVSFELEKDGQDYVVQSDSLTPEAEWILRSAISENILTDAGAGPTAIKSRFRFTPLDVSRLDSQRQKQRQIRIPLQAPVSRRLSQLLRSLGDYFDSAGTDAFHVSWTPDSVSVNYQHADGQHDQRTFTAGKLQELGLHRRFRRSS